MLKVTMRHNSPTKGYTLTKGGELKKGGRTLLCPVRTRKYRGRLASAWFTKSTRATGLLNSAGLAYEENTPAAWGRPR